MTIHNDEASPHLIAYVVPVSGELKVFDKQGNLTETRPVWARLSATEFLDGRKMLSEMQTDFVQNVGASVGLMRVREGSWAKHVSVKEYYAVLNANAVKEPLPETKAKAKTADKAQVEAGIFSKMSNYLNRADSAFFARELR